MENDIRSPIDSYLDAVDLALLKAGVARHRRGAIVRDLEAQIIEMLEARTVGREPLPADIAAVLAGMDLPDAYAAGFARPGEVPAAPPARRPRRRLPTQLLWGAGLLPVAVIGILIVFVSLVDLGTTWHHTSYILLLMIAAAPVILMLGLVSLLGFSGWRAIRAQPNRYWGRLPALIECAAFPFLLLLASPMLFFAILVTAILAFAIHRLYGLPETARRFVGA